ncbi:curli-like amyloid fiber formation chaperone CsgH [Nitratireductor soli]|uniref:curli-like amyloid fiber formation chaperone CsgH n=1 Tax=Nitratireductor soli TaxID=1670619 RepID=UPI00065E8EFB|nr:curli-like amyloid fiber formation chaperone CsgH [Nitratireductor soli]
MLRIVLVLCTLAGLSAGLALADEDAVHCDIRFEKSGGLTTITGLAGGKAGLAGRYRLDAQIVNGSNRSLSRQGGAFVIESDGGPSIVSRMAVSAAPRARIEVELRLESGAENATCRSTTL